MGTQYGAKKMDVLKRQISTTMIAGIVFSIAVTLFCILFARPLLLLIRVQEEVLPLAVSYLRIVFLGFIFTFIYNFFACTLRALGDSTTPLYFLVASSVLNIIGDLFFVAVLRWGSMGCAVNGPGEAKEADFGVAGGDGKGLLFAHGEIVKTAVPEAALADELLALIQERIFSA